MSGRILIIVQNLPVPFDRRVWQEATTLVANGYEVSVICPVGLGCEKRYELLEGVHIFRHPQLLQARRAREYLIEYPSAFFWELSLAWHVFLRRGFDVIHACNPPDIIFLIAAVFKLLFGTKFVFDHHDLCPELFEAKFERRGWLYSMVLWFERLTFHLTDISIATNESYRQIAIERGRMDPNNVVVVRSGPDLERFRRVPEDPALRCGRRYLVGYVGIMAKQEGIEYIIDAAHHIVYALRRTDIHFRLIGNGPDFQKLVAYAVARRVSDYITFAGRVPDADLLTMISTADVCVNSDAVTPMNDKSTMNKIMEYMALGKPIVQFDLTEGRVSAKDASLYARANDAIDLAQRIVQLINEPSRREAMGAFGRKRVESALAWRHQIPALLSVYERLLPPRDILGSRVTRKSDAANASLTPSKRNATPT
jgi:glycosyltransferase involved in cell wall biosynthesis